MVACGICIDQAKNPVSLPCGHIFCANCIVKSIRAVQYFTNFHPCPLCRSIYNIAPVNLRMVPPNLRAFVTPSIRRLYMDSDPHPPDEDDTPIAFTSSDISLLQGENHALRDYCVMWRRRSEIQGLANLNLMKLVHSSRDEASRLARERDELQRHCSWLERKLDDDESLTQGNATSLEPPLSFVSSFPMSPISLPSSQSSSEERHLIDGSTPPRKRLRIDSSMPSMYNASHSTCS